jgi:hypothetical protein
MVPGASGCTWLAGTQAGHGRPAARSRRRPRPVPDADAGCRASGAAHAVADDRAPRHAVRRLADAFPRQRRGIAAIVRVIVPHQAPESGYASTSSPQVFGTVAMSWQPDRCTCAETLVHETQHLKLCALLDLVTLVRPDDGRRYYAPWRLMRVRPMACFRVPARSSASAASGANSGRPLRSPGSGSGPTPNSPAGAMAPRPWP